MRQPPPRYDLSRLWTLVDAYGWSNVEFARRLGVDPSTVWRLRRGHLQPGMRIRQAIRRVFPRADVDQLMVPLDDDPAEGVA